jgi:hypothetical protein
MGLLLRPAIMFIICVLSLPAALQAAEVTNLKTDFTKSRMIIEYDLTGRRGEKGYGVEVSMIVNGTTYTSNMLTLSGDFGSMVPIGTSRKITWLHRDDFPEGLETKFKCIVNAVPDGKLINEAANPSDGTRASFYALNRQTVTDTRTSLMWIRNANLSKKPITYVDAKKYIEKLNRDRYAGYADWRVPTSDDFEGLVFFGKKAGWGDRLAHFIADYLMTCGFSGVQAGNYWTATPADTKSGRLIVANTWNGNLRPLESTNYYYLWPVRDATPSSSQH